VPIALGDSTPSTFRLGDLTPTAIYLGDSLVWVSFTDMGMDKSGNQAVANNTTATVGPWVERSGFPGTVMASNALVANGSASVTINARLELTSNWTNGTACQVKILKNGVQIGSTASIAFNTKVATFAPISTTLVAGDQISMQIITSFGGSGTVLAGSAATYLYFNKV